MASRARALEAASASRERGTDTSTRSPVLIVVAVREPAVSKPGVLGVDVAGIESQA